MTPTPDSRLPTQNSGSKIPAHLLLALDGFKQGFKIAFAEAFGAFALDDFKKQGGPVFYGFGEYLQQVALIVAIYEDAQVFQRLNVFIDGPYPAQQVVVIGGGHF